jgi:formamidopyrimidine-DNA glycosylase
VRRRAKYILLHLDDGAVLIAHLGMSGRMVIAAERPESFGAHDHVVLETDLGTVVTFNDARRFGLMDLTTQEALAEHPLLRSIGPEPLGNEFSGPVLAERLAGKMTSIKAALLDQRVVAGLGNIYVSEALFLSRLSPTRIASTVVGARAERLASAIREVLGRAIEAGGSTLRDHRQASGELGYFQHQFTVYDREGQPCPGCDCDMAETGGIRRIVQAGRSTFYCPRRQR